MIHVEMAADCLRIELAPLDKLWAMHGSLDIPLVHIIGASVSEEDGWSHLFRKVVGTNAPGLKMAGTFFVNGGLAFLDYGTGKQCLVLQTRHETYKTVIVQLPDGEDPMAIAEQINARVKQHQSTST